MNYINYKELFACIVASVPSLYLGINSGFSTEFIYEISQKETISSDTVSWIGGSGLMLSFVGCLIDGYLMDKYGRKSLLYLTFAIHFIGWMVIAKTEYFIFGRFLTGLALGVGMLSTVYISEILLPRYRGRLLLLCSTLEIFGNLFMYLIEFYISAKTTSFILSILALILFLNVYLIPETPYWHMLKKQNGKAIKSLVWLRDGNELTIDSEIYNIEENLEQTNKSPTLADTILNVRWWKSFLLFSVYILLTELSGFDMIIPYSVQFFAVINRTRIDNRIVSSTFVTIALAGSIASMFIVERFKRTTLIKNTNLINTVLLAIAGLSAAFSHSIISSIICLLCIFVYSSTVAISTFSLPWTIISESLPTELRATVFSALSMEFSITYFLLVKIFPAILATTSMNYILFFFAIFSFLNYCFVLFFIKETRGIILPGNRNFAIFSE